MRVLYRTGRGLEYAKERIVPCGIIKPMARFFEMHSLPQSEGGRVGFPKNYGFAAGSLLAVLCVLNIIGVFRVGATADERDHYRYGERLLKGDADQHGLTEMPISALNALPGRWAEFLERLGGDDRIVRFLAKIRTGRLVTVLFSAVLGFYVFRWARDLYGPAAGLFSLFLFACEPTLQVHSQLVTTDVYFAGTATIAAYYFWKMLRSGGREGPVKCACALGLCLITKYPAIFLHAYLWVDCLYRRSLMPQIRVY